MQKLGFKPTVWIVIYAIILLSWIIPPLGVLTALFIMIPSLMLYLHLNEKMFAIVMTFFHILLLFLTLKFDISIVLLSLFFMIPSIVMGIGYKRNWAVIKVIAFGILTILLEITLIIVTISAIGPNVMVLLKEFFQDSLSTVPPTLMQGLDAEEIESAITMMVKIIPACMFIVAFIYVLVTHSLSRQLAKISDMTLPGLPPLKEWLLPQSFVWYYLLILVLRSFVDPYSGTFLATIMWNLFPILFVAFILQAISFLLYATDVKGWNPAMPVIGTVIGLLFPLIFSLLGVFDIAFKLRDHLNRT